MNIILFTKFMKGKTPEQVGEIAARLGFDGLDLAIRSGHCVNPHNLSEALPRAVKQWEKLHLTVPLATLETAPTDPAQAEVQSIYRACGDAGIRFVKLGYWSWHGRLPYWDGVDEIRRSLEGIQKLSEECNLCSLIHTHSGTFYGANASAAMHLAAGFDPARIGVYIDPAHLAIDGEELPMGLDIAGRHLAMVAVKNARYVPIFGDDGGRWSVDWCRLNEGLVNWQEAVRLFVKQGYDGAFSVHGEYSSRDDWQSAEHYVREDIAYFKKCIAASRQ